MKINTLKILSALSFLTIIIPGEKISFPMGSVLLLQPFLNVLPREMLFYTLPISILVIYLFVSGLWKFESLKDSIICLTALTGFLLFIGSYSRNFLLHYDFPSVLMLVLFLFFAAQLLVKLITKIRQVKN